MATTAVDCFYESKRKRVPSKHPDVAVVANVQRTMSELADQARPNNGERYQAQIILTQARAANPADSCVLRVFNSGKLNRFLAFMMDHKTGLVGVRSENAHQSPVFLPEWLQRDDDLTILNEIVDAIYAYRNDQGSSWYSSFPVPFSVVDFNVFAASVDENWEKLQMPERCPHLAIIRPLAAVGSLVIWTGWHGSAPALEPPRPCAAAFVDYAPRSTFLGELLNASYKYMLDRPWEFGAGNLLCRHAGYNNWANQHHGRSGGLSRLGDALTDTHRYLAGSSDAPVPDPASIPTLLTAEDMQRLKDNAYLVIPPEKLEQLVPGWSRLIQETVADLSQHLTDVVVHAERLNTAPFDLNNAADPRWEAVGGNRRSSKRHFGDEFALYKRDASGSRVTNAQSGGSLITAESGMGAATNLYDSPAQMKLQLGLYPIFAQLYRTHELAWLPERCRIRTGKDSQLRIHTDSKA